MYIHRSAEVLSRETAAAVGEQMTEELVEAQSRLTQQEEQSTRYKWCYRGGEGGGALSLFSLL